MAETYIADDNERRHADEHCWCDQYLYDPDTHAQENAEEEEEPPVEDYDPGPGCDDEGGISEYRYAVTPDEASCFPPLVAF